jgi:AraC-like DNA-binding protein
MTMGFDLVNVDRDTREGSKLFISWSKTTWLTNDNPSEWGNLKLAGRQSFFLKPVIIITALLLLILIILFFLKAKKGTVPVEKPDPKEKWDPHVIRASEFIEKHFTEDLTLKEIADNISLSPNWLSEIFTKNTGMTVTHYINKTRIDRAVKLLSTTSESVSQIAFQVGYNNPQHFNKIFRDFMGVTPTKFRESRK